jgi:hypothetical protein
LAVHLKPEARRRLPAGTDLLPFPAMSLNRIRTPCIGVCSTTFGDTVCRGCKRFLHEVVNWNGYTGEQKQIIWTRLDSLLRLVVSNYVVVSDPGRLRQQLEYQNIRFQAELSPEGWVPELLKASGQQPLDWPAFGLTPLAEALTLLPGQLYQQISEEMHALSQAHYDRSHGQQARPVREIIIREGLADASDAAPGST